MLLWHTSQCISQNFDLTLINQHFLLVTAHLPGVTVAAPILEHPSPDLEFLCFGCYSSKCPFFHVSFTRWPNWQRYEYGITQIINYTNFNQFQPLKLPKCLLSISTSKTVFCFKGFFHKNWWDYNINKLYVRNPFAGEIICYKSWKNW